MIINPVYSESLTISFEEKISRKSKYSKTTVVKASSIFNEAIWVLHKKSIKLQLTKDTTQTTKT